MVMVNASLTTHKGIGLNQRETSSLIGRCPQVPAECVHIPFQLIV